MKHPKSLQAPNTACSIIVGLIMSVLSLMAAGCSSASSGNSSNPPPTAPAAPQSLSATGSGTQVQLSWSTVSGATSYNVYFATTPGVTVSTGTKISGVTSPSYTHTALTPGLSYYYVVTAVNSGGESAASNQASATLVPAAPTLSASAGNTQVQLSWTASTGALSYNIYFSNTTGVTPSSGTKIGSLTGTAYTHTSLTNGKAYFYVITAVDAGGESAASAQVSATPAIPIANTATLTKNIPTQYIGKLYTEALGRAPDQAGWTQLSTVFTNSGCGVSVMETIGVARTTFFDSAEFLASNPDPQSQVLAMYRAILNREPDSTGMSIYTTQLKGGTTPANVAAALYTSSEFATDATTICGVGTGTSATGVVSSTAYSPNYGFSAVPAFATTPLSSGITTYSALVSALSAAGTAYTNTSNVQTVDLAQAAMIPVTNVLTVPKGVVLETFGNPKPNNYTQMARLVRASSFNGSVVQVSGGGTLQNVWVDGQRNNLGYLATSYDQANIYTTSGTNTLVSYNKSSDPQGGSNFESSGIDQGKACVNDVISFNLLTGYDGYHGFPTPSVNPTNGPTDGMTMYCENLNIHDNALIDPSDVAIVIMGITAPGYTQHSTIQNNVIISAGISTNAPIHADVITANELTGPTAPNGDQTPGTNQIYPCYEGTSFINNTFWTSPYTAFDFGIGVGGRPYFQSVRLFDGQCADGKGPVFTNNGTGTLTANVKEGIAVSGMLYVTITNDGTNPLNVIPAATFFPKGLPARACPVAEVVMEAGHSGGSVYAPVPGTAPSTANIDQCTFINNGT